MDILKSYIREGEHQTQDFKFRVDDAKKIARTLAAFANTDGGRLLIGVKDNGKIVGVYPAEEYHIIQGAAEIYCNPPVKVETEVLEYNNKMVLKVQVDAVENKPVKAKDENNHWKTYVRRDDHTLLANKILVGVWKRMRKKEAVPQVFDEDEQYLLGIIRQEGEVTISKLYRSSKARLSKRYVDRLLILFVTWGVVKMKISPTGTFYFIEMEKEA